MRILLVLCAILAFGVNAFPASAQSVTPNQVYQAAGDSLEEVKLLLVANFSDISIPEERVIEGLQPRHTVLLTQEILRNIQMIKRINGLPVETIAPLPVRETSPADVMEQAERIRRELRGLRTVFGITAEPFAARPPEGKKTPSHVYARFAVILALLQRLDIPATVPNDVYAIGQAIRADAAVVHARLDAPQPMAESWTISSKTPADSYRHALHTLEWLKKATGHEALAIPGGVTVPPANEGDIRPAEVIESLYFILAELSSLKARLGITEPTPEFPPPSGKTPNEVFQSVDDTLALIKAIELAGAAGSRG